MSLTECLSALSLHDSAARLWLVIEALPIALIVVDRDGRIILANSESAKLFRYEEGALLGRGVDLLVPAESRPLHHLHVQRFFDAGVARKMGVGRRVQAEDGQGRTFPVEISVTPVETDEGPLAVAAIVDVADQRRIESELTTAQFVQRAMLPDPHPHFDGCDIFGVSKPAQLTGGDFFDFVALPDQRFAIAVGDASGHGFAAALVTAATRSYLRALARSEHSISKIVAIANHLLQRELTDGRFVTLFYAKLDPDHKRLQFTAAGHSAYLFSSQGELKQRLNSTGPALGWFEDSKFPSQTVEIERRDIMVVTTDGIEEAMDLDGELFGRGRVQDVVREHASACSSEIVQALFNAVRKFRVAQQDDATVVVVKFG
ncbi:MAG: SpoIIE family protein phosphatase [Planctomycetes bacterium]|nr:SpoIIE family protein phosphatase [Planctomycetota bacterium]